MFPGLLFYFDVTPKAALLFAGCGAALLSRRRGLRPGRWLGALLLAQAVSLVVSTLLSQEATLAVGGTNWRRIGLLSQLAVLTFTALFAGQAAQDRRLPRLLARLVCISGLVAAAYAAAQYFGFDPWLPASAYHVGEGEWAIVRPPSTLGHASYAATFLLYSAFAGVGLMIWEKCTRWKALGAAGAALCSAAIVLTGTRGAMAGLAAGVVLLGAVLRPPVRKVAVGGIAVLAAAAAFYVSPAGQPLRSRVRWSLEDPLGGARLLLWRDAVRMGEQRWLSGWGPETFAAEFPRFQSEELARAYPDFYHESPHNLFLDAFVSQGLPGLAILIALCVVGLRSGMRSREGAVWAGGLTAALVAQQFTAWVVPTAVCFYLFVAVLAVPDAQEDAAPQRVIPRAALVPAGLACLALACALLVSDRSLFEARRQLEAGAYDAAQTAYQQARQWQPWGASSDLWYSRALVGVARRADGAKRDALIGRALDAARQAAGSADDRPNALYNLSAVYALRNDYPGVETSLRRAIDAAPAWYKPHWVLAQVLALHGRNQEAADEARRAASLDGGKHEEVTQTLARLRTYK